MESNMREFLYVIAAIFGVFSATYLVLRFMPDAIPGLILIIIVLSAIILNSDKETNHDNK
jgi:NhaP-type Na+/H+ or K+/H+ antiporter